MLFPDERKFYARFRGLARGVTDAARLLADAFDHPEQLAGLSSTIGTQERQILDAARTIDLGAERMFVAPMDREDIHLLSTRLRRIMDIIGWSAKMAWSVRAIERREPAVTLARCLVAAVKEIELAVANIRNGDEVFTRCREIKRVEQRADAVWETAVTGLFDGTPAPLDVLRWMSVYDPLEAALDACEDVANELETITVKHG
jgi:hypothetical protein